ncbi:hypothetical protein BV25DRAFT_1922201 [Artomyces pyxidatus]|uniref:Uncharacterized protein n=1 Tax=Artomyces pyxidatus TaxID=48021 RepID=A0ACB8SEV3_9AGAM|nr:hypothetical protein BV25DRAFT_1922201 [Artomyces pyxidatus]
MDMNILLSSLSMVSSLVESSQWTVVIPLPVIMELDGLGTNDTPLARDVAQGADVAGQLPLVAKRAQ